MIRQFRTLLAGSASTAALALATAAHAQATPPAADTSASSLGEVVVTAERTVSTVQKTPISIAVVSGRQLETRGVNTLSLLTNVEPTIAFSQGQLNGTSIAIRGVSSSGSTQFGGSAVTVNTDGQYLYSGFNGLLYDIDRIEVLKGPQGTLYGLNATAGAVNIITNAPRFRNSVDANAEIGNYNYWRLDGAANWKASDTLAFRLSAIREMRDGFREHPGLPTSDRLDETGVRLSGLWQPMEKLSVRLTGEYERDNYGNAAQQGVPLTASPTTPAGLPPTAVTSQSLGLNPYSWALSGPGYNLNRTGIVRANVSYDFGPAMFTYIGSYNHTQANHCQPAFGTAALVVDHCSTLGLDENFTETTEHEARLNGQTDFGLKWQGGAFYSRYLQHSYVNIYNGVTSFSPPDTVAFLFFHQPHNAERNEAIYGQLSQSFTSQLTLTGGLRYTNIDQVAANNYSSALNVGAYFGSGGKSLQYTPTSANGESKYSKTTWHLGLDYQATPQDLIYASVGTGFKDGGFTQFNSFAPESITAYEIGTKNRFFENRLQVNAAAYYYDYSNQQAQVFVLQPSGQAALTTVNAGTSSLKGVEANLVWKATPDDSLSAGVTYSNGKYTQFTVAEPIIPIGSTTAIQANLNGNRPPNMPTWTLTAGWDRTWLRADRMELTSSINTRYVSSYNLSVFNMPGDYVKGYMQTDASITLSGIGGHWDASLWVHNLENNTTLNFSQYLVQGPSNIYMFGWAAPRTYGARLSTHF